MKYGFTMQKKKNKLLYFRNIKYLGQSTRISK